MEILKVKNYLGTSMSALRTEFWIFVMGYLMLSFLKCHSRVGASLPRTPLEQLKLFEGRDLLELLKPHQHEIG